MLVLHNNDLNQVTWEQRVMEGDPKFDASQDLPDFDYAAYAESIGLQRHPRRRPRPASARPGTRRCAADRPVVLEAITDPEVPPLPPHITFEQAVNFAQSVVHGDSGRRGMIAQSLRQKPRMSSCPDGDDRDRRRAADDAASRSPIVAGGRRPAYTVPTDAAGVRRHGRVGLDDDRRRRGARRRPRPGSATRTATVASGDGRRVDALADVVVGRDAMAVARVLGGDGARAAATSGRPGVASMAIAAVDTALWDLKARLLGLPLVALLGAVRDEVPVYGSGGFTSYSDERLAEQLGGWAAQGIPRVKMKVGREPERDVTRVGVARARDRPRARSSIVDANGALSRKQALRFAERFAEHGVRWFEEPVSSDDLDGLRLVRDRAPAGMDVAAGEYGYTLSYFEAMLAAGAVDCLQADVTRCDGITGFLQRGGAVRGAIARALGALRAGDPPAPVLCGAVRCATSSTSTTTSASSGCSSTASLEPVDGALRPDLSRPGNGLELQRADADRYAR